MELEPKDYQRAVMNHLSSYMECLNKSNNIFTAWKDYWMEQDIRVGIDVPEYNNAISGVPHVCMKVPTGGGKTFMACMAIKRIFDAMPVDKPRIVVWLVPSDSILEQTINNLSDINHSYRRRLDMDFAGHVGVYTKEQMLNAQNFSPDTVRDMLTICILSYNSLRIDSKKKDVRKVYQENGNLLRFAEYFKDKSVLLADTPDTALIQILRQLSPITIVDESHNAESNLSIEMINNLNPSFILDLTATPRKNSNIISYVDARELKSENMVKLPVIVYNRDSRQNVIQDALQLRASIERQAIGAEQSGGQYIRPIVLFQAQPNINKESETFDKIKSMLIDMGIAEEEIAIKTSKIDDLSKVDLMSRQCKIRYIITVNALKEGWDCPFAYILASLANKTSKVEVEQIVGRILRQPYAKKHTAPLLNTSYVLTCSNNFHVTLESIVSDLNKAGFSRKDFRVGELQSEQQPIISSKADYEQIELPVDIQANHDNFDDIIPQEIKAALKADNEFVSDELKSMIQQAEQKAQEYNDELTANDDVGFVGGEFGGMLNQNAVQSQFREEVKALCIPQFFVQGIPDLFGEGYDLLEPETLSEGFSLGGQDAQVSFELATGEMYSVDIQAEGEAVPKYKRASKIESEYIREFLAKQPPEKKIAYCTDMISTNINRNNRYAASEIADYVHRIVENMTDDELAAMETAIPVYARKIRKKIEILEKAYREQQFYKWLDSGKIVCRDNYKLAPIITPVDTIDSIPYSLYDAEKNDMNDFERQVIDIVVSLDNIKWWHRIIEWKDFRLNGFMNHYPDFMVMTKSGKLLLIEAKGAYLDGDDSKTKLKLGRKWQSQAGRLYRYFMVFEDKELGEDGAYTLDRFVDVVKDL
ncbi:MAG: DEAD/DEAH box helicase family protein [Muribaculaceae bacterium]|nr:DEAD/DEAH box helicase family protein [Muribaculaceae bacterium]